MHKDFMLAAAMWTFLNGVFRAVGHLGAAVLHCSYWENARPGFSGSPVLSLLLTTMVTMLGVGITFRGKYRRALKSLPLAFNFGLALVGVAGLAPFLTKHPWSCRA